MTAGESATPDFDFKSIMMHGTGMLDPGMTEHLEMIAAYERALNGEGGKTSMGYESVLRAINEEWPQHGARAEIFGRLYLFGDIVDAGVLAKMRKEWGEPNRDNDGGIYWDVAGAELASRGIVDDGDDSEVKLVSAYSFVDDDIPSFTARSNEYTASYDRLTKQGGEQYLRREWPKLIEAIDQGLPEDVFDAEAFLQLADSIASEYQDMLRAYDELGPLLSEYITCRAQFSNNAPYVIVLEGDLYYFDEQENRTPLQILEKTLEYIYRPTIVFQSIDGLVSVGLVASSGEGVDDDTLLIIPSGTIQELRPTYTGINLLDRVGSVSDYHAGGGIVELADETELSSREERLEHLRDIQAGILHMIEQGRRMAIEACDTPEEALEVARSGLYSIQSQAEAIGLSECALVVDGEAVALPPSIYEFNSSSEGSLSIQTIGNADFMEPGDQRRGYYSDIQASYRIMEEDDEYVYYPSFIMRMLVASHSEEILHANELAMTEVTVSSHAHVPLESATIVVEQLDREELIDQTLVDLDREGQADVCDWLEVVYSEFFDPDIEELTDEALGALHKVANYCTEHSSESIVKSVVAVIDSMLNNQTMAINTSKDKHELVAGVIVDVKFEQSPDFPPQGLVLTFVANDGALHNIAVGSVKTMMPKRQT